MLPLHMAWKNFAGDVVYRGGDFLTDAWLYRELIEGVVHPGGYSDISTVVLQNVAQLRKMEIERRQGRMDGPAEKLMNVRLYLASDPDSLELLTSIWPVQGGGVEISFDQGISWKRFTREYGNVNDPSTWILLQGSAVSQGAPDGELDPFPPFNRATLQLRLKLPSSSYRYGLFTYTLGVDCDVL